MSFTEDELRFIHRSCDRESRLLATALKKGAKDIDSNFYKNVLNLKEKLGQLDLLGSDSLKLNRNNLHYIKQCCKANLVKMVMTVLPEYERRSKLPNSEVDYEPYLTKSKNLIELLKELLTKVETAL